jgi:hypothetical protein
MGVVFFGGLLRFPDNPIHECQTGYCGKQNQPHTRADYDAFVTWEKVIFIIWPLGMVSIALLQKMKFRR